MKCIEIENVITTRVYPATVWSISEPFRSGERADEGEEGQEGSKSPECHVIKITGGKLVDLTIGDTLREETAVGFRLIKSRATILLMLALNQWPTHWKPICARLAAIGESEGEDNIQLQFLYLHSTFKWVAPGLYGWFGAPGYWEHYHLLIQSCMSNSRTNAVFFFFNLSVGPNFASKQKMCRLEARKETGLVEFHFIEHFQASYGIFPL